MFGVSIGPPYEDIAEKPTSSSTMYTTLGAPSGAFGGSNGDQSGTESRMSTLIVPLNCSLTTLPPRLKTSRWLPRRDHSEIRRGWHHPRGSRALTTFGTLILAASLPAGHPPVGVRTPPWTAPTGQ